MLALTDRPVATEERICASWLAALDQALEGVAGVIQALNTEVYRAGPLPEASGSIGEHVRQCLDDVSVLVSADPRLTCRTTSATDALWSRPIRRPRCGAFKFSESDRRRVDGRCVSTIRSLSHRRFGALASW